MKAIRLSFPEAEFTFRPEYLWAGQSRLIGCEAQLWFYAKYEPREKGVSVLLEDISVEVPEFAFLGKSKASVPVGKEERLAYDFRPLDVPAAACLRVAEHAERYLREYLAWLEEDAVITGVAKLVKITWERSPRFILPRMRREEREQRFKWEGKLQLRTYIF